ncbi:hypothetical protein NKR19_g628 [Coniochaeta hoffmannii]|uniref:Uncharacterized protein n=1 Tax=Coniochaeta hoffmannii TaxID=91930 RepID=A0AA38SDR0_9PEZI|nr:hypothetical protein NKR19_g628 [Coniochaeta hoffmannii]
MDTIKKIIHPHKTDHTHDPTTTTDQHHGTALRGSDTGENIANPFSEPGNQAGQDRLHQHNTAGTTAAAEGTHLGGQQQHVTDRGTAHAYGTGVGAPTAAGDPIGGDGHHDRQATSTAAATGAGAAGGASEVGDSYGPGVNTGGAKVVEARMPVEEGNNFPGTNPNPAHNALGTKGQGGLTFPGGE